MGVWPQASEHNDVLEIIYHILGLGFEGRYSVRPDGRKQLDDIRQQLLTQLVQRRDPITPTLSPGLPVPSVGECDGCAACRSG